MVELSCATIKGLFHHLVVAVGGVEAAAAFLDVSHPRISQLQGVNYPDMPTVMQIAKLERVVGRSVVFEALAARAAGGISATDLAKESREATYAAVDLQRAIDSGASRKELLALHQNLLAEAAQVEAAIEARGHH